MTFLGLTSCFVTGPAELANKESKSLSIFALSNNELNADMEVLESKKSISVSIRHLISQVFVVYGSNSGPYSETLACHMFYCRLLLVADIGRLGFEYKEIKNIKKKIKVFVFDKSVFSRFGRPCSRVEHIRKTLIAKSCAQAYHHQMKPQWTACRGG